MLQRSKDLLLRLKGRLHYRSILLSLCLMPAFILLYVGAARSASLPVTSGPGTVGAASFSEPYSYLTPALTSEQALPVASPELEVPQDTVQDIHIPMAVSSLENVTLVLNGNIIYESAPLLINGITYAPLDSFLSTAGCRSTVKLEADGYVLSAEGRAVYSEGVAFESDGVRYVPLRSLVTLLGGKTEWDAGTSTANVTAGSVIRSSSAVYNEDDLYWLSRIIYSESGNQPFDGMVAVGNVVMNRVANPSFPNNIHDVVFAESQFTPVKTGTIYRDPSDYAVMAAKVCLEGFRFEGEPLFFLQLNVATDYWMVYNCEYVFTIADHTFYTA